MDENTTTDDQVVEQLETVEQPEPAITEPEKDAQTGYALYDHTLQRFVGPVRSTKGAAGKDPSAKGHRTEVRAV